MRNKIKHSKIRNTGLLFEFLLRQITADVLEKKSNEGTINIVNPSNFSTSNIKVFNVLGQLQSIERIKEDHAKIEATKKPILPGLTSKE